jgi:hypothetical protein
VKTQTHIRLIRSQIHYLGHRRRRPWKFICYCYFFIEEAGSPPWTEGGGHKDRFHSGCRVLNFAIVIEGEITERLLSKFLGHDSQRHRQHHEYSTQWHPGWSWIRWLYIYIYIWTTIIRRSAGVKSKRPSSKRIAFHFGHKFLESAVHAGSKWPLIIK